MSKFTYYQQLDIMDCGPTCLRMVAKHYGRHFTAQSLRERAQIGKDGVSLLGIAEAAEAIGFRSLGAKVSFEKLAKEAPLPCIVHWQQNHFVVVYAITGASNKWLNNIRGGYRRSSDTDILRSQVPTFDFPAGAEAIFSTRPAPEAVKSPGTGSRRGTVYVADPARGLVSYTAEEFCEGWLSNRTETQSEGVALLLEPTPAFHEQDDEQAVSYSFGRVLGYLGQYKQLLVQLLLGLAVGSGLQLLVPFLTQSVVDIGINTQNVPFIYLVLGAQLMLMVGRLMMEFIQSWLLLHISTRVNLSILSDFLIKLMRLPLSFFDTKRFGDIMQRVGDHHRIETFVTGQAVSLPFALANISILSVVIALYSLPIFGVYVVSNLLYAGWIILFLRQRRKLDTKRFDLSAQSQSALVQLIQGMQEIKLAGAERQSRWAWERLQARLFRWQMKSLSLGQYQQVGAFLINDGKNILITFLAAQAVINGQLTLGAMLAMQQLIGQLNGPVNQLVGLSQSLQDAKISLERLNEIHTLADEEPAGHPTIQKLPAGGLEVHQLSFRYPGAGNEPVLSAVDLQIPAGKTTAIVGMSGSGKTTLLKLLLKFYDPSQGEIRLGEAALRNISHAAWRAQCGVVMQEGFVFSDTIARNIAVGAERIDAQKLEHAVRVANLREFVDGLPLGLHTKIGTEGTGISQGQRQRILIARTVYKDPQFIFFDEATNALDATNEAIIMKNLDEFFRGRTVIIVAHRLSTVCHADQIVVLDKGTLIEGGTHAELVAQRGAYWQLVKNQLELGS
ncbi:peptidase domain-containing ABC transporter [Hymenobacter monticola]|uniref:Peptidase domain-containing ABC transporter n=1 Tax=Hymenobacter monticola TaxID=1705399 RepID=A0ABY4BB88_9BACT|nr:peptidase domain-containing ABC transporter [Hymenobacter monticola]UOE36428.1 peptidase domain-containing ABC transporter [Hymenobacter monticola]